MLDILLTIIVLVAAGYDYSVTKNLFEKTGGALEINPLVKFAVKHFGIKRGAILGIGIPTALILVACWIFHLPQILGFLAGVRAMWMWTQVWARLKFGL